MLVTCRRKKEARKAHDRSEFAQKVHGLRAKMLNKKRYAEKATMKKTCVRSALSRACVLGICSDLPLPLALVQHRTARRALEQAQRRRESA